MNPILLKPDAVAMPTICINLLPHTQVCILHHFRFINRRSSYLTPINLVLSLNQLADRDSIPSLYEIFPLVLVFILKADAPLSQLHPHNRAYSLRKRSHCDQESHSDRSEVEKRRVAIVSNRMPKTPSTSSTRPALRRNQVYVSLNP